MLGFRIADFELRIGIVLRDIGRNAGVFKNGGTSTVDTQKWTGETSVRYMLLLGTDDMNHATNLSMAIAISSGTSYIGKWLRASSFNTWNHGCVALNDRWAAKYPGSSG